MDRSASAGPINVPIPGRTDKVPIDVHGGSYVFPADFVNAIAEDNSIAGNHALHGFFYGNAKNVMTKLVRRVKAKRVVKSILRKGRATAKNPGGKTPIIVAGGEFVADPEAIKRHIDPDLSIAHDLLDELVKDVRAEHIRTLKKLPAPKTS